MKRTLATAEINRRKIENTMCDNEILEELKDLIDGLSERLDDLCDSIEDTVEDAVTDAVEDAVTDLEDAMSNMSADGAGAVMYIISQDGKHLMPFGSAQAFRKKKGEEPYCIQVSSGKENRIVGTYENKAAALAEIKNIAAALRAREDIYEIK